MPAQIKNINGKMNLDTAPSMLPQEDYSIAFNIVRDAQGEGQDKVVSNMVGTTLVPYTLPTGVNKSIGNKPDLVRNRIYIFVWNSLGNHSILYYDAAASTISPLIINLTDSNNIDILGFNPSYRINHIDIVYRDDGDLMFWTDGLNLPSKINVQTAINGGYGTFIRSYLDVAKEPPTEPIACIFENDTTVTVNNIGNKLYIFKCRFIFDDLETSVTSTHSILPLPLYYSQTAIQSDPTKNADIFMVLQTGNPNVKKIEILAAQSLGNVYSDFFSVIVLDKALLSIPNNDVTYYRFYNNQLYNYIDVTQSIELFDYVPNIANTQALPNGNVLTYSAIKENYDLITPDFDIEANTTIDSTQILASELLYATQQGYTIDGVPSPIRITVAGTPNVGDHFEVDTFGSSSGKNIQYTVIVGDTIASILSGLSTSASGQGFTIVSTSANDIVVSQAGESLQLTRLTPAQEYKYITVPQGLFATVPAYNLTIFNYDNTAPFPPGQTFTVLNSTLNTGTFTVDHVEIGSDSGNPDTIIWLTSACVDENVTPTTSIHFINNLNLPNDSKPAYDWNSNFQFGVVYFDEKDKTNSVITEVGVTVQTSPYIESGGISQIPYFTIEIANRPPIWATHFSLVRTPNLTKSKFLYWISARTFQDTIQNPSGYQYAYISIATLNTYISDNPSASILAYSFTPNDRIRFIKLFAEDGSTAQIYTTVYDFPIINSLTDPIINGLQQQGQILQINLPSNINLNFNFGGNQFANYLIEIYTPALSVSNNSNTYFEFGETYNVQAVGQATRFHQGKLRNQKPDLTQSALFDLYAGDAYFRTRIIPVGNEFKYGMTTGSFVFPGFVATLPLTLNNQSFTNPNYVAQSYPTTTAVSSATNIFNVVAGNPYTITLNITGFITFTVVALGGGYNGFDLTAYIYSNTNTQTAFFTLVNDTTILTVANTYTYNFNIKITLGQPASEYLAITLNGEGSTNFNILAGQIVINEATNIPPQGIIDPNFSDFYQSDINSNGRAYIVDPNAKQTFFPTLIRFGQAYQDGTNINNINKFYSTDFDEYDRSNGSVTKLFIEGKYLYVFQQLDIGVVPILQQIVTDTANNPLQTDSDKLLNTIQYPYKGKYGMTFPESFAYFKDAKYGVDGNKKVAWRLSQDGIEAISILYECNAYFQSQLPAFNSNLNNGNPASGQVYTGNPTVYGGFDFFTNKYIIGFEAINRYDSGGNLIFSQPASTIVFWETREANEGFETFTNYYPEGINSFGSLLYTLSGGKLYLHNNTTNYCNFYGVQYYPSITLVFNKDAHIKKTFLAIAYQGNQYWVSPTNGNITTSQPNAQTGLPQISQLIQKDYEIQEGLYYASFLNDANSLLNAQEALVNGDVLKGVWISVLLTYIGSNFGFMYLPYINWSGSPKNP